LHLFHSNYAQFDPRTVWIAPLLRDPQEAVGIIQTKRLRDCVHNQLLPVGWFQPLEPGLAMFSSVLHGWKPDSEPETVGAVTGQV
jgi:hypothetical protein